MTLQSSEEEYEDDDYDDDSQEDGHGRTHPYIVSWQKTKAAKN